MARIHTAPLRHHLNWQQVLLLVFFLLHFLVLSYLVSKKLGASFIFSRYIQYRNDVYPLENMVGTERHHPHVDSLPSHSNMTTYKVL